MCLSRSLRLRENLENTYFRPNPGKTWKTQGIFFTFDRTQGKLREVFIQHQFGRYSGFLGIGGSILFPKKYLKSAVSCLKITVSKPQIWGTQGIFLLVPMGTKSVILAYLIRWVVPKGEVYDFSALFHRPSTLPLPCYGLHWGYLGVPVFKKSETLRYSSRNDRYFLIVMMFIMSIGSYNPSRGWEQFGGSTWGDVGHPVVLKKGFNSIQFNLFSLNNH